MTTPTLLLTSLLLAQAGPQVPAPAPDVSARAAAASERAALAAEKAAAAAVLAAEAAAKAAEAAARVAVVPARFEVPAAPAPAAPAPAIGVAPAWSGTVGLGMLPDGHRARAHVGRAPLSLRLGAAESRQHGERQELAMTGSPCGRPT
jgi:hypothetical protein